jgi:hypothetical protein
VTGRAAGNKYDDQGEPGRGRRGRHPCLPNDTGVQRRTREGV